MINHRGNARNVSNCEKYPETKKLQTNIIVMAQFHLIVLSFAFGIHGFHIIIFTSTAILRIHTMTSSQPFTHAISVQFSLFNLIPFFALKCVYDKQRPPCSLVNVIYLKPGY